MFSSLRLAAFAVLVLSLLSTVTDVAAHVPLRRGPPITNAERLARGLGPVRPRKLYSGTRTNAARTVPSGAPRLTQKGLIKFVNSDDTFCGYMGLSGFTSSIDSADTFCYDIPTPADALVGFTDVSNPSYRLAAFASSAVHLGPGDNSVAYIENVLTGPTPAGSPPSSAEGYGFFGGYAETTIFSVDPTTGKITVQWVNTDGSIVYLSVYIFQTKVLVTNETQTTDAYTAVDMYYNKF